MKPIAYIDRVSGKPKLIDAYVVQTPVDIPLYTAEQIIEKNKPEIEKANAYIRSLETKIEDLKKKVVSLEFLARKEK